MRMPLRIMLLVVLAAAAAHAPAHGNDSCLPMEASDLPVCRHVFEGGRIALPVRETLDGIDTDCDQLAVVVLQRQGALFAPLGEPRLLDADACRTMTSFDLELPNVRSETDLIVSFVTTGQGIDEQQAAAAVAIRVYPDTLLDALKRLAERRSFVVFDDDGNLVTFLDTSDIDYATPFHGRLSDKPIALLVRPQDPDRLLEERGIDTAVIFTEQIVDLPQVRTVSTHGRTHVFVEMPLINELSGSPLAQKALLRIINLAINPFATDRG